MTVTLDRAALARYGLSVAAVQDAVSIAMGGAVAGQVFEGDRRFDIVVRLPEGLRQDREALASLPIALPEKQRDLPGASASEVPSPTHVPLGEVATIEVALGPNQTSREHGKRRVVVTANVDRKSKRLNSRHQSD